MLLDRIGLTGHNYGMEKILNTISHIPFLAGMASVLDFGGTAFKTQISENPLAADHKAIQGDWVAIGGDLRTALGQYEHEQK